MAKNNLHLLVIMTFGVLLSAACSINTGTPSHNNQDDVQITQCISPQMFSYPIRQDEVVAIPQTQPVLPLSPWKQFGSLPASPVNMQIDKIQTAMSGNKSNKIWVIRQLNPNGQSMPDHRQLLSYQPETENLETVIDQTQNSEFIPDVIFRAKDEKIWGLKNGTMDSNTPILSLFSEKKRKFEFVEDSNSLLKGDFFGFSNDNTFAKIRRMK